MRLTKQQYPSLNVEAGSMINLSLLIYSYADLRKFARANPQRYQGEDHILSNEEVSGKDIVTYVKLNKDLLKEDIGNDDKAEYHYYVLVDLIQRLEKNQASKKSVLEAKVVSFDDKDGDSELVHGVAVNPAERRISVVFRGSATASDWYRNVQVWAKKYPNPLRDFRGQSDTIDLHSGFSDYLFEQNDDGGRSKYQNIIRTVKMLCKKYPSFTVYTSGHSLGGALSSLFAFFVATEKDDIIKKPIRCITFASPLVGDRDWRSAFMLAEDQGLVRYLRVTNDKDIVPTIPTVSLFSLTSYKHVGIHLRLLGHGQYLLTYPKNGKSSKRDVRKNMLINCIGTKMLTLHSAMEYDRRLDVAKEALSRLYIDNLYDNQDLVGESMSMEEAESAST